MSSKILNLVYGQQFALRLAEICGSAQPAEVARKLGISYQSARNYLGGRLPDSSVLLLIAEQTPYSIHWLLTGSGEKLVEKPLSASEDAVLPTDQIRSLVRAEVHQIFSEIVNQKSAENTRSESEIADQSAAISGSRVIRLKTSQIKDEQISQDSDIFAGRETDGRNAD